MNVAKTTLHEIFNGLIKIFFKKKKKRKSPQKKKINIVFSGES